MRISPQISKTGAWCLSKTGARGPCSQEIVDKYCKLLTVFPQMLQTCTTTSEMYSGIWDTDPTTVSRDKSWGTVDERYYNREKGEWQIDLIPQCTVRTNDEEEDYCVDSGLHRKFMILESDTIPGLMKCDTCGVFDTNGSCLGNIDFDVHMENGSAVINSDVLEKVAIVSELYLPNDDPTLLGSNMFPVYGMFFLNIVNGHAANYFTQLLPDGYLAIIVDITESTPEAFKSLFPLELRETDKLLGVMIFKDTVHTRENLQLDGQDGFYDFLWWDDEQDTMTCAYKMKVNFPQGEFTYPTMWGDRTTKYLDIGDGGTIPCSVDYMNWETEEIYRTDDLTFKAPTVQDWGCECKLEVKYDVVIMVRYTNDECSGCVNFATPFITRHGNVTAKCKGKSKWIILQSSLTYLEATTWLNANYDDLIEQYEGGGTEWAIVGYCDCRDESCTDCVTTAMDLSVVCNYDLQTCEENTKLVVLQGGFETEDEANGYLLEHGEDLKSTLRGECPGWYCIYIQTTDPDIAIPDSGCWRAHGEKDLWDTSTLNYFRANPDAITALYGDGAYFIVVNESNPYYSEAEAEATLKWYKLSFNIYGFTWYCNNTPMATAYVCKSFYNMPFNTGLSCQGGSSPCGDYGDCRNFGSRLMTSLTEVPEDVGSWSSDGSCD